MGRTLKRVPLDFDWPLKKVWSGYINPHGGPCPEDNRSCFGGYTAAGKWLESIAQLMALVAGDGAQPRRNGIWPHPFLEEFAQAPRYEVPREVHQRIREIDDQQKRFGALGAWLRDNPRHLLPPTKEFTELVEGIYGQPVDGLSGSGVGWAIQKAIVKAAGLDENWGTCRVCDGHGDDPSKRDEAEAWRPTEPPAGDGFQLWETTSEGSPASPVFASLEELCSWCADHATTFANYKATADEWRKMLDDGFVHHTEGNMVFM